MSVAGPPLLQIENLSVEFGAKGARVRVVDDVSFSIAAGETVGLVGESGSGKSIMLSRSFASSPSRPVTSPAGACCWTASTLRPCRAIAFLKSVAATSP